MRAVLRCRFSVVLSLLVFLSLSVFADEKKSLETVRSELFGADPLNPSADSILGKFITDTGASTVARRFLTAPKRNKIPESELGPKRLVVAVSENTFPEFKKRLTGKNYLYVYFTPGATTLHISFQGKEGNPIFIGKMNELRYQEVDTLMLPILLDSDEADRVANYIKTALAGDNLLRNSLSYPWNLFAKATAANRDEHLERYAPKNKFAGCTHWFGDLPIGNALVDSYSFPSGDEDGSKPNTQKLAEYDRPAGMSDADFAALQTIWTYPGHQVLGDMLGPDVQAAHRRGEMTNVGWLMYTLLGSAGTDRVPVLYRFVKDEKDQIGKHFKIDLEEY